MLDEAQKKIKQLRPGDHVIFQDKEGRATTGSVRIKEVRCGKKRCTKCPHKIYAYARYRTKNKVTEKYIGIAR